ncbi:MAG TPA: UDP-N-acetylmuramate--L-alanine ligase [Planctomycetaceae bacterium]|nr:UDP-N-acetylmuramate--L-alanine ligase [Planctomycetaceae bacterium]
MAVSGSAPSSSVSSAAPIDFKSPGRAHLVGIGGTGMQALAEYLSDAGWTVSGSDDTSIPVSLEARGLRLLKGHRADAIPPATELVIHSAAVLASNPELLRAVEWNIPILSYAQALGMLTQRSRAICIAGTHGKSTTAAMTAHLLQRGNLHPSAIVGAETIGRNCSGWCGASDLLVLESCEYRRHFLGLSPAHAVVTGIEEDHFDCYPDRTAAIEAFGEFVALVPAGGTLAIPADNLEVWSLVKRTNASIVTFGIDSSAEWNACRLRNLGTGTRFELRHRERTLGEVQLRVPGRHNVMNALAAIAVSRSLGLDDRLLTTGLESFCGIRRRFEILARNEEFVLIDDYAHHPTAVRETLTTAREMFPGRRIRCLFQPHQISRIERLLQEFGESLTLADESWIGSVFTARESNADAALGWSERLAESCRLAGGAAQSFDTLDRMVSTLEDKARSGDVILTVGAGNINRIHHDLIGRLFRNSESG